MKLVIGLGNPGSSYENTRHNVGFMVLDAAAKELDVQFQVEPKLKGMLAKVQIGSHKAILLKPLTYMNLSGESVRAVMNYYKIPVEDILVISDDLDSPTGRVRLRSSGSAGGHNGHKSIIAQVGTEEYKRLKIGISRSEVIPVIDWVLQKFSKEEMIALEVTIQKASLAIKDFIEEKPFNQIASFYSMK